MKDPAEKRYVHGARFQVLFGLANGINCFKNPFLVLALVQGGVGIVTFPTHYIQLGKFPSLRYHYLS